MSATMPNDAQRATRHGGHVVADVLAAHGISEVFGQDSPEWLFAVLDESTCTVVTMRDERSAGFAADAAARLTGRPAVAAGIHGPGALNLTTALFEAREACSPVVALVSGVETTTKGTDAFQDVDQVAVARSVVKWAARVERPDRLGETVDRAIRTARAGRPGPVLVELPNDVMGAAQPAVADIVTAQAQDEAPAVSHPALVEALARADRPALLLGSGAVHASREGLVELADRLGAVVCVTAMGRGAFPETSAWFAGVAGFMSDREDGSGSVANAYLRDADVVLALGTGLDGVTTDGGRLLPPSATVVRVDVDADRLARDRRSDIRVLADVTSVLRGLAQVQPRDARPADGRREALARDWARVREAQRRRSQEQPDVITPSFLFTALQEVLGPEDIVVCDAAYSSLWALSYLRQGEHFDRICYGRAAGTLGFGLPGAVGAAAAFPGRRVVAIVGDGGLGFAWSELETAVRAGADITCIVLNNSVFAYQRLWHELNGTTPRNLEFVDVRHDDLARAVGGRGVRVTEREPLDRTLREALEPGLALVDVVVDPVELPPFRKERHVGH